MCCFVHLHFKLARNILLLCLWRLYVSSSQQMFTISFKVLVFKLTLLYCYVCIGMITPHVPFCTQLFCGSQNYFCAMCRKKSDLVIFTTVSHKIHLATPQYATLSSSLNNYLFIFCKMLTLRLTFAIFYWERIFQIPFFRNIMKKDECREITLRL